MSKVYVLIENDADPYCGYYIKGVFSSREKAEKFRTSTETILDFDLDNEKINNE